MSRFTIIGENIPATRVLRLNGKRVDLNDDGIQQVIYNNDGKNTNSHFFTKSNGKTKQGTDYEFNYESVSNDE